MKRLITTIAIVVFSSGCASGTEEDTFTDTLVDTASDTALDSMPDISPDSTDDPIDDTPAEPDVVTDTLEEPDVVPDMESDIADDDGGATAYSHTIVIDGTNDFDATDEQFSTSSSGYTGFVAWDDSYLYIGMVGPDLSSASTDLWILIYLGGPAGTSMGQTYNTQQPALPFDARYHVRWKVSNDYTNAQQYSGSWADLSWDFTGDVYLSGTFVEMRIPLADIGSPTLLDMAMFMINEASGSEWSYAACPSSSFTDGIDPDLSAHYSFDIGGTIVPTGHTPII